MIVTQSDFLNTDFIKNVIIALIEFFGLFGAAMIAANKVVESMEQDRRKSAEETDRSFRIREMESIDGIRLACLEKVIQRRRDMESILLNTKNVRRVIDKRNIQNDFSMFEEKERIIKEKKSVSKIRTKVHKNVSSILSKISKNDISTFEIFDACGEVNTAAQYIQRDFNIEIGKIYPWKESAFEWSVWCNLNLDYIDVCARRSIENINAQTKNIIGAKDRKEITESLMSATLGKFYSNLPSKSLRPDWNPNLQ